MAARPTSNSPKYLIGLNEGQAAAVAVRSGPLLVLAGAGTGKTRVVTVRIAELIRTGTSPSKILAVTFTNKAAKEMQERIAQLLGKKKQESPLISTFHSLCVRILRRHAHELGYPDAFAICDRGDQESYARQVLREIRAPQETLRPADLLARVGHWKNAGISPSMAAAQAATDKDHIAASGYRRYQTTLKAAGAVDFDDLLLLTEELFTRHGSVLAAEAKLFDHILVDEYQDTNGSQYRIIKSLASRHRNLCVVGDDDQSIYGWRGAEVQHILNFSKDWPEAKIVRLEENYRCTGEIIKLANQLISFNKNRHEKQLRAARGAGLRPLISQYKNETEEAQLVVADIQKRIENEERSAGDFAILFRTNEQPRPFEAELRKAKIPYVLIGGMSFFDRKEVRDVLAYLRVINRPDDEVSLLRILNTPPRGIGPKLVGELMDHSVKNGQPLWQTLSNVPSQIRKTKAADAGIHDLRKLVAHTQNKIENQPLAEVARQLLDDINYESELIRNHPEEEDRTPRWAAVEQVINSLAEYERDAKEPNLLGFLDSIALGDRALDNEKEKQLNRDAVVLMTLHSAKGLEFPEVYLVGLEENILPHHRSLADETEVAVDEERRLCYVGLTRAQERLSLSLALARMKWGKPRDTVPSRFLFEMTGQAEKAPHRRRQQAVRDSRRRPTTKRGSKSSSRKSR